MLYTLGSQPIFAQTQRKTLVTKMRPQRLSRPLKGMDLEYTFFTLAVRFGTKSEQPQRMIL